MTKEESQGRKEKRQASIRLASINYELEVNYILQ